MRYAHIESGTVTAVADIAYTPSGTGWIEIADQDVAPGDVYDAATGTFSTPAPVVTPRLRLTKGEFRDQFTTAEKQAIYTAAESSVDIKIFLDDLMAVKHVDLDFPKTINSVNELESLGLIGTGRAAEILSGI